MGCCGNINGGLSCIQLTDGFDDLVSNCNDSLTMFYKHKVIFVFEGLKFNHCEEKRIYCFI